MQKINSSADLRIAIMQLEHKQAAEGKVLKNQFHQAYENAKPVNLIKNAVKELTTSDELKGSLVNASVALGAGYLSKKVFDGAMNTPLRKLLGTVVMFGVTNVVAKNPEAVKEVGIGILRIIFGAINRSATHGAGTGQTKQTVS